MTGSYWTVVAKWHLSFSITGTTWFIVSDCTCVGRYLEIRSDKYQGWCHWSSWMEDPYVRPFMDILPINKKKLKNLRRKPWKWKVPDVTHYKLRTSFKREGTMRFIKMKGLFLCQLWSPFYTPKNHTKIICVGEII